MRFGAIDVGTNSIHLIVVELDPYVGTMRTIAKFREMIRLGGGNALIDRRLGKKAILRGVEAIARFVDEARRAGTERIRIVATSAVRDAKNQEEFCAAVRTRVGLEVEVLSGREEARLIHLGVSRGCMLDERIVAIVDIGGGSTEIIVADHQRTRYLTSLPLGSLRLYERFRHDETIDAVPLRTHIHEALMPFHEALHSPEGVLSDTKISRVIGTSGTWLGLAALDAADRQVPFHRGHSFEITLERIRLLQARMLALPLAERKKMPGMNPRRSDILLAGAEVAIAILEGLGCDRALVCDHALREGIVADDLQRNHDVVQAAGDERLRRLDAVRALAARFNHTTMHEAHVSAIALELFDSFAVAQGLDPRDRDMLCAAAWIHDIGTIISASSHHKHGAYLIRNSILPWWPPTEREILAQIVRYHRKGLPKTTHTDHTALDVGARRRVAVLAALLRIADGLDASHESLVSGATITRERGRFVINVRGDGALTTELAAARGKADLFARLFGHEPTFRLIAPIREQSENDPVGSVMAESA